MSKNTPSIMEKASSARDTDDTSKLPDLGAHVPGVEKQPLLPVSEASRLITPRFFIIMISFFNGLYQIRNIGEFMYQKEHLSLSPNLVQILLGVTSAPYTLKPIFGFLYDKIIFRFRRTKYIIVVTSIVRIAISIAIANVNYSWAAFTGFILLTTICEVFERIVAETTLVISTKKENDEAEDKSIKANHLPVFFGFKSAGSFLGLFFGGRIVKSHSVQFLFFLSGLLPIIPLIFCLMYLETAEAQVEEKKPVKEEMKVMRELMSRPKVVAMALFIFLIHLTPSYDTITSYYLIDELGFDPKDLADLSSCSLIAFIVALVWYSYSLYRLPPKRIFMGTNFLLWVINCSFLLVVFKVIHELGISEKAFCLLNYGMNSLVAELNFMPILAIWCAFCPKNLEATAITLFTAMIALSYNFGTYFGIILSYSLGVNEKHLGNFWALLVIQNVFLIFVLLFITAIGFPDPSEEETPETVSQPLEDVPHEPAAETTP